MWAMIKCIHMLIILLFAFPFYSEAHFYDFIVREASYTRLCETKNILTVNGQFPGPTIGVQRGDIIVVSVYNYGTENITLHWHGVKQPRNPWTDGPEYITQCPIQPGAVFRQTVIFSDEEGTVWWHAHSDWSRATVHGAIIVYPAFGAQYPFPKPDWELPIILGEWWREDIREVFRELLASGGQPRVSDAFTINGQPGDLYPCSRQDMFKLRVRSGNTYLLRIINADMNDILFFGVANHTLTVVGTDGSYTKPLTVSYIAISPGQTMDCLLRADNPIPQRYYMAARPYNNATGLMFNNSTTTAIVEYVGRYKPSASPPLPVLPPTEDTLAAYNFSSSLRSLNPVPVPLRITTRIFTTVSLNFLPCPNRTCQGPEGNNTRFAASMNNQTFVSPSIDILEAYYYRIRGVFGTNFPSFPPFVFNYTADNYPVELELSERGTQVKVIQYGSPVEVIFQGTNLVAGIEHPMHLHGYSFYVVGSGFGNFDANRDPLSYNLVDPPRRNTISVPKNGWTAIRFRANNPGVWFMHCHFERHMTWGMNTVFIVKNGDSPLEWVLPPPPDMPPC